MMRNRNYEWYIVAMKVKIVEVSHLRSVVEGKWGMNQPTNQPTN